MKSSSSHQLCEKVLAGPLVESQPSSAALSMAMMKMKAWQYVGDSVEESEQVKMGIAFSWQSFLNFEPSLLIARVLLSLCVCITKTNRKTLRLLIYRHCLVHF